jgi:hypothetical protein
MMLRAHSGFKSEAIASYVRANADIPLTFSRPVDKAKVGSLILMAAVTISAAIRAWPYLRIVFGTSVIWSIGTIVRLIFGGGERRERS